MRMQRALQWECPSCRDPGFEMMVNPLCPHQHRFCFACVSLHHSRLMATPDLQKEYQFGVEAFRTPSSRHAGRYVVLYFLHSALCDLTLL